MTAEPAETLKRLAKVAYELDAFKPNIARAEADRRIAALAAKLKRLASRRIHSQLWSPVAVPQALVLGPTISAARVAERTPASAANPDFVLLAGAAAALFIAGGTFHFTRQSQRKARTRREGKTTRAVRRAAALRSGVAGAQPRITTDPAKDLRRSLAELKRGLEGASQAALCVPPVKMGSSGDAILPPASSWLNRRRVKPSVEPATSQFAEV